MNIQKFLVEQGISMFADRYTVDGEPLSTRHSVGSVGWYDHDCGRSWPPFRVLSSEELWRTPVAVGEERYFDGKVYLMSMLHCSGRFRYLGTAEPVR